MWGAYCELRTASSHIYSCHEKPGKSMFCVYGTIQITIPFTSSITTVIPRWDTVDHKNVRFPIYEAVKWGICTWHMLSHVTQPHTCLRDHLSEWLPALKPDTVIQLDQCDTHLQAAWGSAEKTTVCPASEGRQDHRSRMIALRIRSQE